MKIILATSSKFKSKILSNCHIKHTTESSNFYEISDKSNVYEWVEDVAYGKALNVANNHINEIIIGVDTVVYFNKKIIGKPLNREIARNVLNNLSGNENSIITGIALINLKTNQIVKTFSETKVKFRNISNEDINYYIDNEEYILDSSGYIIDNILSCFIDRIDGSYYNILGMPVETIYMELEKMGYKFIDFE